MSRKINNDFLKKMVDTYVWGVTLRMLRGYGASKSKRNLLRVNAKNALQTFTANHTGGLQHRPEADSPVYDLYDWP